ncbi:MAG: hypothetical protein ABF969_05720 [Sporolactobacillus sp.]
MKCISKTLITSIIGIAIFIGSGTTQIFAKEKNDLPVLEGGTPATQQENQYSSQISPNSISIQPLTSQANSYTLPGGEGEITSNAWRSSSGTKSGNTIQWDYQVSAVYSGKYKVESIRTTWQASASLRNSASINLGISGSGVSVGTGSSWNTTKTKKKYWENDNGAKESDYRSNIVVSPSKDYRTGTISIVNTAKVKLKSDAKPYSISAGA